MSQNDRRSSELLPLDENGNLNLTMEHMVEGADFPTCNLTQMKYNVLPALRANKVTLRHNGEERILKDRGD